LISSLENAHKPTEFLFRGHSSAYEIELSNSDREHQVHIGLDQILITPGGEDVRMTGIKIGRDAVNRITVSFPYNPDYIAKIKTIEGHGWHPEEKYWSIPSDSGVLDRLAFLFEGERVDIDPSLQTRVDRATSKNCEDLRRELVSRKYSPKTIKAYVHYNENLLRFAKKSPAGIATEDIKNYLFYLAGEKESSASPLNIAMNALTFYYGGILKKEKFCP